MDRVRLGGAVYKLISTHWYKLDVEGVWKRETSPETIVTLWSRLDVWRDKERRVTRNGQVYQCFEQHWYRLDREYDVPSGGVRDKWTPVRDETITEELWRVS